MASSLPGSLHRRVLMVAYEFPPLAAGGVARTVRFARYLPQFGWQPHILTASNPAEPARDETLLDQLPECARIHRTRSWEHHVPRDLLTNIAGALGGDRSRWREGLTWRLRRFYDPLAIPDHKIFWAAPAVLAGVAAVLRHRIDAVYSTSWPYSDHIAAMSIARLTGRPLVVDFRDPWTQHFCYGDRSDRAVRRDRWLERTVCRRAGFVITPAHESTRALRQLLADLPGQKFVTIRNGYDPASFTGQVEPLPGFEIVHAGTFYKSRRPDTLVQGLARFLERVPQARKHTRLRLFGMSLDGGLADLAGAECVELHGWTAHQQVVRAFRESSVLFLLRHFESQHEITLPSKAYEYMASGNHVLAVQVPQRELDRILRAYGNATILRKYEPATIAAALEQLYGRWRRGELTRPAPPAFVQRFSRVALAGQLASLLDQVALTGVGLRRRGARTSGGRDELDTAPAGTSPVQPADVDCDPSRAAEETAIA